VWRLPSFIGIDELATNVRDDITTLFLSHISVWGTLNQYTSIESVPTPTAPTHNLPTQSSALQDGPRHDESIVVQRRMSDSLKSLYQILSLKRI